MRSAPSTPASPRTAALSPDSRSLAIYNKRRLSRGAFLIANPKNSIPDTDFWRQGGRKIDLIDLRGCTNQHDLVGNFHPKDLVRRNCHRHSGRSTKTPIQHQNSTSPRYPALYHFADQSKQHSRYPEGRQSFGEPAAAEIFRCCYHREILPIKAKHPAVITLFSGNGTAQVDFIVCNADNRHLFAQIGNCLHAFAG